MLALAGILLLVVVVVNGLRTQGGSSTGPPLGGAMAPFAAPLALTGPEGDVNVARRAGQGAAGAVAACDVRGAGVLRSCDLVAGSPAVLVFFTASQDRCVRQVDRLDALAAKHPGVRIAAIALGGSRRNLRDLVVSRRWSLPVAHDRDAVLGNLYGVAVCPQVTQLLPGGKLGATSVGELSVGQLAALLDRLESRGRLATVAAESTR
ncbi:unannotated protein [freshwater metagenome]|uniref:Unannotated protein n=1 Tax=freshwater metagenome TaxID=449393 RepID=A0A6J7E886_9ZZZZ